MSASIHRYQKGDPAGMANDGINGRNDWPEDFMEACRELEFAVDQDTTLRMRLWSLWKEGRELA